MPHRLRRLGTASAAVSAGALVLLFTAPAADAAAAEVCKKGVDPESTIENWKCNLGNLREALTPKSPEPTPTPKPARSKTTQKTAPSKSRAPAKKEPRKTTSDPGGRAPAAGGPSTMTGPGGLKPVPGEPPSATAGVLPTPEIAADPNAYLSRPGGTVAMPRTRLISPVAASGNDNGQMLLVAAAAGAAGAVGALHLSVAARTLRRRSY